MDKKLQAISNDIDTPAEDTRALIAATADAGGEKVREARHRLSATLENGKEIYGRVRDKAVEGVKATNDAVYEHPYQGIGIALGVGAIIGCLIARRWFPNGD
jgi:ElaB/YqjD/DUF883 family membrane-anchored ribosome-binding protein